MATNRINPLAFKHLKATDTEQTLSDGGGLFIRVRSINDGGSVTFRFCYRFEGKQKWANLKARGLADARLERDAYKLLLKTGVDPNLEKDLERERKRKQQLDEQEALAKLQARVTVRDLFIRWRDTDLINRKDSAEISRMFNKDVLPVLGSVDVSSQP
ncbi:MAG: Arm DNA-binding domain-containing protein [Methylococcaceae bacterium]|jgi:hypothetical protein